MCYGGPDTIDWSYTYFQTTTVIVHIPTNKHGCCLWRWSLVVFKDKLVVLGLALA